MNDLPKISIVTPSYNQGHFLEQTIRSVLSQEYPNLEYIVIDGGSTDGSVEIIKRYEQGISFWCSEKDNGQYDAVNKGFSKSTGEILGWINSDDVYFPWTLITVAMMMRSMPEMEWLSSLKPASIDYKGFLFALEHYPGFSREAFLEGKYLPGENILAHPFGYIQQESTFWRRSLWEKSGEIRRAYKLAGDFDLWARFFQHADLWGCPIPLAGFRTQYQQRSANFNEYRKDCKESLNEMRKTMKWSRNVWRKAFDWLGLPKIPLVVKVVRKLNYFRRLNTYVGFKLVREKSYYPDANWVSKQYRF
jgi:glycosyltransferase involved in cell wall biosynthesis